MLLFRFSQTISESPKDVCSNSETSEEMVVQKLKRRTPLKELFAESVGIQKECLNVLKDIRNQNNDVVSLLGLLLDQMTDRNDIRGGSQDIILNGVPSNCKTSRPKKIRPTTSSVGPASKIAKLTYIPDTDILQERQIEIPTPSLHTETNIYHQQKPHEHNLQSVQLQQHEPHQQKLPFHVPSQQKLLLALPCQKQLLQSQPPQTLHQQQTLTIQQQPPRRQELLFQLPRQQKQQRLVKIQRNNPR